jgi:hypothetical protein
LLAVTGNTGGQSPSTSAMRLKTQCYEITGITSSIQGRETIVVSFQFHFIVAVEAMHAASLHAAISFFWGLGLRRVAIYNP